MKRRMKELFRLNQHQVKKERYYDFWVVMKKRFSKEDLQDVDSLFIDALKKVDTFKPQPYKPRGNQNMTRKPGVHAKRT